MKSAVNCKLLLYTNDSMLVVSGYNISEIEASLSKEFLWISKWLVDNKLSLHSGKTKLILFSSHHYLKKCSKLKMVCNYSMVKSTTNVKFLGVEINQTLCGGIMVNNVIKKITARTKCWLLQLSCVTLIILVPPGILVCPKCLRTSFKSTKTS